MPSCNNKSITSAPTDDRIHFEQVNLFKQSLFDIKIEVNIKKIKDNKNQVYFFIRLMCLKKRVSWFVIHTVTLINKTLGKYIYIILYEYELGWLHKPVSPLLSI